MLEEADTHFADILANGILPKESCVSLMIALNVEVMLLSLLLLVVVVFVAKALFLLLFCVAAAELVAYSTPFNAD